MLLMNLPWFLVTKLHLVTSDVGRSCTSSVSPVGGPANLIDAAGGGRQGRKYNFPDYCIPKYNLGTRKQRRFIPTLIARGVLVLEDNGFFYRTISDTK